jgi:hypothetical protein
MHPVQFCYEHCQIYKSRDGEDPRGKLILLYGISAGRSSLRYIAGKIFDCLTAIVAKLVRQECRPGRLSIPGLPESGFDVVRTTS